LAVKTAFEMTYTVTGGALNCSVQSNPVLIDREQESKPGTDRTRSGCRQVQPDMRSDIHLLLMKVNHSILHRSRI